MRPSPAALPVVLLSMAMALVAGCCPCRPATTGPAVVDRRTPPTLPMSAVVNAINANNQRIPSLWASLYYNVSIDDQGQTRSVSGDGVMLYRRPGDFLLVGEKEFVGRVFEIGSNGREYWLKVVPGGSRMWWGRYADLAHVSSDRLPIPIRPDLVMEVLGVGVIDTNFTAQPVPTMHYDGAADAYVFAFNVAVPGRWLAQKEVWYDRRSLRPTRVVLYDANGRPVLVARLSIDRHVRDPDDPNPGGGPLIAGDFKLFFPDSGSRMEFTLRDARLYNRRGRVTIPNAASFRLPDVEGTDVQSIQIGAGGRE